MEKIKCICGKEIVLSKQEDIYKLRANLKNKLRELDKIDIKYKEKFSNFISGINSMEIKDNGKES